MKLFKKMLFCIGILLLFTAKAYGQDKIKIKINGVEKNYSVAPVSVDRRTMLPLRDICQDLHCEVTWDAENKTA